MLVGKRTYLSIIAIVITVALSIIETGGTVILSPEVTAGAVTFFGILAAYFRREATR
jgi:hypothetical protein